MGDNMEVLQTSLAEAERLIIKQEVEYLEAGANAVANAVNMDSLGAIGEQANKYDIFTDTGGKKFRVIETSEVCSLTGRMCCRPHHALQLHVYEEGNEIMWMDRPFKLGGCGPCQCCGQCFACTEICQQEMKVYTGPAVGEGAQPDPKNLIGYIQQPVGGGMLSPQLNVMDREGAEPFAVIQAEAVCCIAGLCCDHTFTVKDMNGNYMGKIVKERPEGLGQLAKELATDADNFTLYTPKDMDVKHKAVMMSALHLVDYMFFEDEGEVNLDFVNGNCTCKCCDLYCFGCTMPCKCSCGGGGGGSDGDGGGD